MGVFDRNEDPKDPQVVFRRQAKRIVELYGGDADRMAEEANDIGATVVRQNGHWLFTSGEWTEVVPVDPSAPKKIVVNLDAIKPVDRDMVPEKAVERILSERIARDFVTVVAGSGGVGKTSWLIATILTMSTGGALLADLPHSSGGEARHRVLYANLEDGQAMVDRLLRAAMDHHKRQGKPLNPRALFALGRDSFSAAVGGKMNFLVMDHETRSVEVNPSSLDVLRQIIVGKKIDVLIMDPMKNLYGGMQMSNEAVNVIYDSLAALAVELNTPSSAAHIPGNHREHHAGIRTSMISSTDQRWWIMPGAWCR